MQDVNPRSVTQKCIVHAVRNSLRLVDDKDMKPVTKDLRALYTAPDREAASLALDTFCAKWHLHIPAGLPPCSEK